MRILLVENDRHVAQSLLTTLKAASMVVDMVDTGEEALEYCRLGDFDVVLLAQTLPDMDGYDVVRRLRAARLAVPVLMLAETSSSLNKVKGFAAGADDVVSKPVDPQELVARIHAVVRRAKGFAQPHLTVGELTLNLGSHEATVAGTPIHLTGKEYAILELLVLRKGMVVTKEAFLNHLYGGMDEPEVKIIDVFICKLRKKLAQAGAENLIGTAWGRGYMLRDTASAAAKAPAAASKALQFAQAA